ncbi:hypothetical protein BDD41_3992 [Paracoccus versutus]|uniref:Uncharacterized protein n=1 Tax=Paracoccus versutus TaxID=34007 RepID=A0A3D9XPU7_PARVE|nr:hypothetical protein BDD41_3992 [Paracoccus versutus]
MLHCLDALNARKSEGLPLSTGIFPKKRDLWFFGGWKMLSGWFPPPLLAGPFLTYSF